jgi:MFS family permease
MFAQDGDGYKKEPTGSPVTGGTVTPTPATPRTDARKLGLLFVLCGAIFLEGIDVAMLNVALPSIRDDLGLSTAMLSGVVSAYVLGYGGFMLLGGRAADILGRRRMFLTWLTVFLVFSGLGGLATEGWMLLAARFVTGVAAAFMTPAGLSLVTTSFAEGPERNRAVLIYAATGAAGFTLGLVAGGLLASVHWRWVFFAPVVLSALILVAATLLIEDRGRPPRVRGGFDLAGAAALTSAMLLLVYGAVRLEHPGRGWPATVAVLGGGVAMLALFVWIERRTARPLVRLGILRFGPLRRANVTALLFAGSFFGFQFLVTLYLQEVRGWSTLETGLALLVVGIDAVLAPTVTPRLVERFGNLRVTLVGLVVAAVAYALFLRVQEDWAYAAMLPTLVLLGVAFTLAYGPLTIVATDGVPEHEQGLASGLFNTAFQFGGALGLSAVTAVHVGVLDGGSTGMDAVRAGLAVPVVASVLAVAVTASGLRGRALAADAAGDGAAGPVGAPPVPTEVAA